MIRAWVRLVGIRRGRFDAAAPAGRLAGRCGLCCVAVGWRLCACRCDRLASALCVMGFRLLAVTCGGLCGWPAGCRLCPCPVPVLVGAVSLRPVGGGLWGRIYQTPRRLYRARKTPSGAAGRPAGSLFSASIVAALEAIGGPPCRSAAPVGGWFSWSPPPVFFWRGPLACWPASVGSAPRQAPRKTSEKTHQKNS